MNFPPFDPAATDSSDESFSQVLSKGFPLFEAEQRNYSAQERTHLNWTKFSLSIDLLLGCDDTLDRFLRDHVQWCTIFCWCTVALHTHCCAPTQTDTNDWNSHLAARGRPCNPALEHFFGIYLCIIYAYLAT